MSRVVMITLNITEGSEMDAINSFLSDHALHKGDDGPGYEVKEILTRDGEVG